jgi:hypothetical protein
MEIIGLFNVNAFKRELLLTNLPLIAFLATSSREFKNEQTLQTTRFAVIRLWIDSTTEDKWGTLMQTKPFKIKIRLLLVLTLSNLLESSVEWAKD